MDISLIGVSSNIGTFPTGISPTTDKSGILGSAGTSSVTLSSTLLILVSVKSDTSVFSADKSDISGISEITDSFATIVSSAVDSAITVSSGVISSSARLSAESSSSGIEVEDDSGSGSPPKTSSK